MPREILGDALIGRDRIAMRRAGWPDEVGEACNTSRVFVPTKTTRGTWFRFCVAHRSCRRGQTTSVGDRRRDDTADKRYLAKGEGSYVGDD